MLDPDQSNSDERHGIIVRFLERGRLYTTSSGVREVRSSVGPRFLKEVLMSDPADVIATAIRSAFDSFPKENDPDWRGPSWIMPDECAHLTRVIMRELEANGFQIVKRPV
jgi:hypothetical protein